jgi:uncharacterized phage infection (PIP) family protein YhgE
MRQLVLAALTLLLIGSVGCRSKQTANAGADDGASADTAFSTTQSAPEPASSTAPRDFTFDQRQQFVESIRQQLATVDQQISELSDQAKSKGGAVSDRALASIRTARKAVDRSLSRVDAATAANWEQVRRGITQGVERLSESIEAAQPK